MAEPKTKLPDIQQQLDALPYDDTVKENIHNAYYAADPKDMYAVLGQLPIPNDVKNKFVDLRMSTETRTQAPPAAPQKGYWQQTSENVPKSAAKVITGLPGVSSVQAVTEPGASKKPLQTYSKAMAGLPLASALPEAVEAGASAIEGYKKDGLTGAIAGAITPGWNKLTSVVDHYVNLAAHPIDSFRDDPIGTAVDVASIAIPSLRMGAEGKLGAKAQQLAQKVPGFKPKAASPPEAPVVPETPATAVSSEPPPVNKARESAKVFEGPQQKPASRELMERLKAERERPKGQKQEPAPAVSKTETSQSKSLTTVPKPKPSTEALSTQAKPKPFTEAPPKSGSRFTAGKEGVVDTEYVERGVAKSNKTPEYVDSKSTGPTIDAEYTDVTGEAAKQLPPAPDPKTVKPISTQNQLPPPEQSLIDHNSIAKEVGSDTVTVSNLDKLPNEALTDIISQHGNDLAGKLSDPSFDPAAFEQHRRISQTAKAIMRERAKTPTVNAERPLNYTPDMPVTPPKAEAGIPSKSAVVVDPKAEEIAISKRVFNQPKAPIETQAPEAPSNPPEANPVQAPEAPSTPEVPASAEAAPVAVEPVAEPVAPALVVEAPAPVAAPVKPVKPKAKPKAAPPEKGKTNPPPAKPPATPTLTPVAPKPVTPEPAVAPAPKADYTPGKGEVTYTRKNPKNPGITDSYTVAEGPDGITVKDNKGSIVGQFKAGTKVDEALGKLFPGNKPVQAGSTAPVKSTPPPAKPPSAASPSSDKPIEKPTKPVEKPAKQVKPVDKPVSLETANPDAARAILKRVKDGEELTLDLRKELHKAVGEDMANVLLKSLEEPDVNKFRLGFSIGPDAKAVRPKVSVNTSKVTPTEAEFSIKATHSKTGDNLKQHYTMKKEGDKFVLIDSKKRRIASYSNMKNIAEAIKTATENIK